MHPIIARYDETARNSMFNNEINKSGGMVKQSSFATTR